jgi:hypothetical protein
MVRQLIELGTYYKNDVRTSLSIPANEYVTKSVQILAMKRSGKSYTGGLIAEQLMHCNIPIVIIDPIGAHWGLREKFDIIIFGDGDRTYTDVSILDEKKELVKQARAIGEYIATNKQSVLLDLSHMSETHQQIFGAEIFNVLYKLNRERRHLFVEEADIFAPQIVERLSDAQHSRHQLDNLVRRGGQKGIGTTTITQRPALVSKNILSQSELTIILRTQSPQDLKAVMDVLQDSEHTKQQSESLRTQIKTMSVGEALFYSPEWLNISRTIIVGKRETYHAGCTLGDPEWRNLDFIKLKPMDLEELKNALATTSFVKENVGQMDSHKHNVQLLKQTIEDLEKRAKEKEKTLQFFKEELDKKQDLLIDKEEELANYTKLREVIFAIMNVKSAKPYTGQLAVPIQSEVRNVVIEKITKDEEIDESTWMGKILYLIAHDKLDTPQKQSDLFILIGEKWGIGDKNYTRVSKKIAMACDALVRRPYEFLVSIRDNNGIQWVAAPDAKNRIIVKEVKK